MFKRFPFTDKKNTATITCCHIMKDNQEILYASHDSDDGIWQFLCGKSHDADEAMIVSLEEIYKYDNSIAAIARLPLGYEAERTSENSKWVARSK